MQTHIQLFWLIHSHKSEALSIHHAFMKLEMYFLTVRWTAAKQSLHQTINVKGDKTLDRISLSFNVVAWKVILMWNHHRSGLSSLKVFFGRLEFRKSFGLFSFLFFLLNYCGAESLWYEHYETAGRICPNWVCRSLNTDVKVI